MVWSCCAGPGSKSGSVYPRMSGDSSQMVPSPVWAHHHLWLRELCHDPQNGECGVASGMLSKGTRKWEISMSVVKVDMV